MPSHANVSTTLLTHVVVRLLLMVARCGCLMVQAKRAQVHISMIFSLYIFNTISHKSGIYDQVTLDTSCNDTEPNLNFTTLENQLFVVGKRFLFIVKCFLNIK